MNQTDAKIAIQALKPFKASALWACKQTSPSHSTGWLNRDESRAYYDANQAGIIYTVYSYGTPIAWLTNAGWYRVSERFTRTTSCHQRIVGGAVYAYEQGKNEQVSA